MSDLRAFQKRASNSFSRHNVLSIEGDHGGTEGAGRCSASGRYSLPGTGRARDKSVAYALERQTASGILKSGGKRAKSL
jgi:hypothetical protein